MVPDAPPQVSNPSAFQPQFAEFNLALDRSQSPPLHIPRSGLILLRARPRYYCLYITNT